MAYVIPFALRPNGDHYTRLPEAQEARVDLLACTGVFRRTMGLPCAHEIENHLADAAGGGVLELVDVHPHWRYRKPERHFTEPAVAFLEVSGEDAPPPDPL